MNFTEIINFIRKNGVLLGAILTLSNMVSAESTEVQGEDNYSNGMFAIMTGDRLVSHSEDDGVASVSVIVDGDVLQFDMGMRSMEHLLQLDVSPARINNIFFTHLHVDTSRSAV